MAHAPLDRPPIVEALLDFRVHPGHDDSDATARLKAAETALRHEYPKTIDRLEQEQVAGFLLPPWSSRDSKRLRSEDDRCTLLVSPARLTFSMRFHPKTKPYTKWEGFEERAFAAWEAYEAATRPAALVGLATRFVNRLEVAPDRSAEVFKTPPDLPIQGSSLQAYFDRRTGRTLDGFGIRVGRRFDRQPDAHAAIIFFDVEAFHTYDAEVPVPPVRRGDLATLLYRLRTLKNDLFFNSLTTETLDLYRDDDS